MEWAIFGFFVLVNGISILLLITQTTLLSKPTFLAAKKTVIVNNERKMRDIELGRPAKKNKDGIFVTRVHGLTESHSRSPNSGRQPWGYDTTALSTKDYTEAVLRSPKRTESSAFIMGHAMTPTIATDETATDFASTAAVKHLPMISASPSNSAISARSQTVSPLLSNNIPLPISYPELSHKPSSRQVVNQVISEYANRDHVFDCCCNSSSDKFFLLSQHSLRWLSVVLSLFSAIYITSYWYDFAKMMKEGVHKAVLPPWWFLLIVNFFNVTGFAIVEILAVLRLKTAFKATSFQVAESRLSAYYYTIAFVTVLGWIGIAFRQRNLMVYMLWFCYVTCDIIILGVLSSDFAHRLVSITVQQKLHASVKHVTGMDQISKGIRRDDSVLDSVFNDTVQIKPLKRRNGFKSGKQRILLDVAAKASVLTFFQCVCTALWGLIYLILMMRIIIHGKGIPIRIWIHVIWPLDMLMALSAQIYGVLSFSFSQRYYDFFCKQTLHHYFLSCLAWWASQKFDDATQQSLLLRQSLLQEYE